jgi:hypothetical protein
LSQSVVTLSAVDTLSEVGEGGSIPGRAENGEDQASRRDQAERKVKIKQIVDQKNHYSDYWRQAG